jgi:hypothetical protein
VTRLTFADVARFAEEAGFRGDRPSTDPGQRHSEAAVAVAIAYAESGGNPNAINPASHATGLWQIYPGDPSLVNPIANAHAAWSKYDAAGRSFSPWTTFKTRAYVPWLGAAEKAVHNVTAPSTIGGLEQGALRPAFDVLAGIGDLGKSLVFAVGWLFGGGAVRIAQAGAGALLVLVGIALVFWHSKAGESVRAAAPAAALA